MGSILRKDKIGTLQESGGNILLGPSILTIGGQQYETTSQIQVTPSGLSANTWYRIFAIAVGGVVQLTWSANNNNSGPSGSLSWKLLGVFFSSRLTNIVNLSSATEDGYVSVLPFHSKIIRSVDQTGLDTSPTKVVFDQVETDDFELFDSVNNGIEIPEDGVYNVIGSISANALSGGERLDIRIRKNGGATISRLLSGSPVSNTDAMSLGTVALQKGDIIVLEASSNADGNWTAQNIPETTFLSVIQSKRGLIKDEDL